jgi:putative membrane protein
MSDGRSPSRLQAQVLDDVGDPPSPEETRSAGAFDTAGASDSTRATLRAQYLDADPAEATETESQAGAAPAAEQDLAASLREQAARESRPLTPPRNPPGSRWGLRFWALVALLLALWGGVELGDWLQQAREFHPLAAVGLGILFALLLYSAVRALRQARTADRETRALEALRAELATSLERHAMAPAGWLERLTERPSVRHLEEQGYADPGALHEQAHAGWSAQELQGAVDRRVYARADAAALQLIRAESVRTGVFVASSPWILADMLLTLWRNAVLIQRVAALYGIRVGVWGRLRLARRVLQNIAFAGASELAVNSLSTSLLSDLMGTLTARVAQGVGVGLYSARIGVHTMALCRATPVPDRKMLERDGPSIARSIRNSAGLGDRRHPSREGAGE